MPHVDLSDVRCYYELIGSGDPLLLIPGLGRTCRSWDEGASQLAESFTLIMPDNRGIGRSAARRAPKTLANLAVDLIELLDALGVERSHVLGISLGGMIAQWLAVEHPQRVDRLVLISTAHHFAPYLREMSKLIGYALRYFPRRLFERTIEILGSSPDFIDGNPLGISERIELNRRTKLSRVALARQLMCLARSDVANRQYQITAPTLVMSGEQDALIPACYGRQIARDIAGSEFALLPGCGHNPFIEMPQLAVSKIEEFLTRPCRVVPDQRERSRRMVCVDR